MPSQMRRCRERSSAGCVLGQGGLKVGKDKVGEEGVEEEELVMLGEEEMEVERTKQGGKEEGTGVRGHSATLPPSLSLSPPSLHTHSRKRACSL